MSIRLGLGVLDGSRNDTGGLSGTDGVGERVR